MRKYILFFISAIIFYTSTIALYGQSPLKGDHPIQKIQEQLLQADLNCSQDLGAYIKNLQLTYLQAVKDAKAQGQPQPAPAILDPKIINLMYQRRMKVYTTELPQIIRLRKGVLAMADSLTTTQLAQDQLNFEAAQAAATAADVIPTSLEGKEANFKFQPMYQYLSNLQEEKIGATQ